MDVPSWYTIHHNGNNNINKKPYRHINGIGPEFFIDNFINSEITNEKFAVTMYHYRYCPYFLWKMKEAR